MYTTTLRLRPSAFTRYNRLYRGNGASPPSVNFSQSINHNLFTVASLKRVYDVIYTVSQKGVPR